MTSKPSPEQQGTIGALLDASRRPGAVPVRRTFLQQGTQSHPKPGPLRGMVRAHDERAFDLYLLHRVVASSEPWDATRDARIWARALGLPTPRDNGAAAVSKTWKRLEKSYHLVSRERRGRLAKITSLLEDGTGKPYASPTTAYFKVPFDYWTAEQAWYATLSFPAKATLMIALSLQPPFLLPTEKAPKWYGLSTDTAERGLRELQDAGLLHRARKKRRDWLAATSFSTEFRYTLQPPFPRARRQRGSSHLTVVAS